MDRLPDQNDQLVELGDASTETKGIGTLSNDGFGEARPVEGVDPVD
jgi:hypothetical protein